MTPYWILHLTNGRARCTLCLQVADHGCSNITHYTFAAAGDCQLPVYRYGLPRCSCLHWFAGLTRFLPEQPRLFCVQFGRFFYGCLL